MLDIKWIREKPEALSAALVKRGWTQDEAASKVEEIIGHDEARRAHLVALQEKQERRNAASKEIGNAMRSGDMELAERLKAEVADIKSFVQNGEATERDLDRKMNDALAVLPNIPLDGVPLGKDENDNVEVRRIGEPKPKRNWTREHFEIGEALGEMDFERAAKLSGSRFTVLSGQIARLERALGQFMLDLHTNEHGYTEMQVPLLVRDEAMFGTGQLPKFVDDLYCILNDFEKDRIRLNELRKIDRQLNDENDWLGAFNKKFGERMNAQRESGNDVSWTSELFQDLKTHFDLFTSRFREHANEFESLGQRFTNIVATKAPSSQWLIPTAEVSLTNMVREEIVANDRLPLRLTALTPCFRSEAGSAGRDTRGMLRQHQFYKVELVSITAPEDSIAEHERMTGCAEEVLKRLDLPFRTVTLCTGDMGFGARKTYDIEVWLPGQNAYREISSCSVCGDFQARRMNARYRRADGKGTGFVHTLNGSGVAVGRALIAVIENYQNEDGSVTVPQALRPYMGGLEKIGTK